MLKGNNSQPELYIQWTCIQYEKEIMTFLRRAKFLSFDFSLNFSQEITRGGVSYKEKTKPEKGKTWNPEMMDRLQDDGDHRQLSGTSQQHWGGRREDSKRDVTKKIKLIGRWMQELSCLFPCTHVLWGWICVVLVVKNVLI